MSFRKILTALDDSDLSKEVFDRALELAKLSGAELTLLSCVSSDVAVQPLTMPADVGLYPDMLSSNYADQQIPIDTQVDRVKAVLQTYAESAAAQNLHPVTEFEIGNVGPLICETAGRVGADLIVLGRRGRKGLSEVLLGSVSNYVLHHAHCCVLVVQGDSATPPH